MNIVVANIYLSLTLIAFAISLAMWWKTPAIASKVNAFFNRPAVIWGRLVLFMMTLSLVAWAPAVPREIIGLGLFLGTIGSPFRLAALPFGRSKSATEAPERKDAAT